MNQRKIISAVNALSRFGTAPLPIKVSYGVFKLRRQLEPHYTFELEQEKKLLAEFGGTVNKDKMISFEKEENAVRFANALSELNDMEVDVDFDPVYIQLDELAGYRIAPDDIEALQPFIVFE